MKQLYKKSELAFSLVWIGIYVVLFSLADGISETVGISKLLTAPLALGMSAFLLLWITRMGLKEKYGLRKVRLRWGDYLWFLPLAVLASVNFWNGAAMRFSVPETVLYVASMLGVGVLEELLFRGFLFKALCRENVRMAFWVSSLTFGMGHVMNLLGGAAFLPTLLQIIYAAAGGFLFTMIFFRSGTLLPCIAAHSLINALDAFSASQSLSQQMVSAAGLTAVALFYALWIWKKTETVS